MPATGRYVKEAAVFDENGIPTSIPKPAGGMAVRLLTAAALLTIGYLVYKQRKTGSFANRQLFGRLGKALMTGSLGVLGAAAPASPALPSLPLYR
jgi:hypothetical protein